MTKAKIGAKVQIMQFALGSEEKRAFGRGIEVLVKKRKNNYGPPGTIPKRTGQLVDCKKKKGETKKPVGELGRKKDLLRESSSKRRQPKSKGKKDAVGD